MQTIHLFKKETLIILFTFSTLYAHEFNIIKIPPFLNWPILCSRVLITMAMVFIHFLK